MSFGLIRLLLARLVVSTSIVSHFTSILQNYYVLITNSWFTGITCQVIYTFEIPFNIKQHLIFPDISLLKPNWFSIESFSSEILTDSSTQFRSLFFPMNQLFRFNGKQFSSPFSSIYHSTLSSIISFLFSLFFQPEK